MLTFTADSTQNDKKKVPVRRPRKMENGNYTPVKAVFNNILDPQQRDFSSGLRDYVVLEPTIGQTKAIDVQEGLDKARKRFAKSHGTSPEAAANRRSGPSSSPPPRSSPIPSPSNGSQNLATSTTNNGSLNTLLLPCFSVLTSTHKNRKQISLQQLVEFGRFLGQSWGNNSQGLKVSERSEKDKTKKGI